MGQSDKEGGNNGGGGREDGPLPMLAGVLSAPAARIALARLVDGKIAAAEILVVQPFDRRVGRRGVHLDKSEPSRHKDKV